MNVLFAALVNGMVAGAAIASAVWIALRLMPLKWLNAATRYAVWWAVLAVVAALPFRYAFSEKAAGKAPVQLLSSDAISLPAEPRHAIAMSPRPMATGSAGVPVPAQTSFHRAFPIVLPDGPWPARVLRFWFAISVLMFIRLAVSAAMLERRKGRASDVPPALSARIAVWAARCHGANRRSIRLVISREISIPLVARPWRPSILLPAQLLDQLNEGELEQIGIHEAAHLVRRDDYALLLQRVIEAVFALHPVVRWISNRIDLEREIACDDFVIEATGNSQPYAACLARVVEVSGGVRSWPVAAAAVEGRSHLARRVEMLFNATRNAGTRLLGVRLAMAAVCIAALSWGAVQTRSVLAVPAQTRAPAAPVADIAATGLPVVTLTAQATPSVAAPPFPSAPVHADASMVFIPVEVRDPLGRFVTGLDKEVFKVQEDGVDQAIDQLLGWDAPTDIFVLTDPRLGLGTRPFDLMGFPLVNAAVHPYDIGRQNILDAVRSTARDSRRNIGDRKAMLILTTSLANTQNYSQAELNTAISASTMPVYTLEVLQSAIPSEPSAPSVLTELSAQTGGQHIAVAKLEDLPEAVHQVVVALNALYLLGYVPSNRAVDGAYRRLDITLAAPRGLPKLTARSRPGYIAPTQ